MIYHASLIQLLEKKDRSVAEKIMPAMSMINEMDALIYAFF
jgi:hypothetical protein